MSVAAVATVALALLVLFAANLAAGILSARSLGVRVEEVSLGVGKPLRQWERAGVVCTLGLVPLGGYVRLGGMEPTGVAPEDTSAFANQSAWKRAVILAAGPLAFLFVAWVAGVIAGVPTSLVHEVGAIVRWLLNSPLPVVSPRGFLGWMRTLGVGLFVANMFPLAGMNGLRLLVLALEALTGRRLGADFEQKWALVSFALIVGFALWGLWARRG